MVAVSLFFSVVVYRVATEELDHRLGNFTSTLRQLPSSGLPNYQNSYDNDYRQDELLHLKEQSIDKARSNLMVQLYYVNAIIVVTGGIGCYYLARRTLRPIEAVHQAQTKFSSDASHELRTPLAAMKAETEATLRDPNATANELREVLNSNLEEVDKMSSLTSMLLDLSRVNRIKDDVRPFKLTESIETTLTYYKSTERARIKTKFSNNSIYIKGNEVAISTVFKTIIDNAIKYSDHKHPINIVVTSTRHDVRASISNHGVGISQDHINHIFDRFYRADASRNKKIAGYGLGLALAKEIVHIHNGYISVKSVPDDITTFTVILPIFHKNARP